MILSPHTQEPFDRALEALARGDIQAAVENFAEAVAFGTQRDKLMLTRFIVGYITGPL